MKLLPCPFCGAVPELYKRADSLKYREPDEPYVYYVVMCVCGGQRDNEYPHPSQAIEAWNRRAWTNAPSNIKTQGRG
jgi:Lar family restriction alleviation protein